MKILVTRDDLDVMLVVTADYPISQFTFSFRFTCYHEWEAKLLQDHVAETLGSQLQAIRRAAYKEGYKDGRAKRKKKTVFYRDSSTEVGF